VGDKPTVSKSETVAMTIPKGVLPTASQARIEDAARAIVAGLERAYPGVKFNAGIQVPMLPEDEGNPTVLVTPERD
jgi:hypothetical protein